MRQSYACGLKTSMSRIKDCRDFKIQGRDGDKNVA